MRRIGATLSSLGLTLLLAGSVLAGPPAAARNSFIGDFDVLDPETGLVAGHVVAHVTPPTDQQVAPGTLLFTGESWYPIKSIQVAAANSMFWIDPNGGLPHAEVVGAACDIVGPGGYTCHEQWTVMFREVPGEPNSVLFSTCWVGPTEWDFNFDTETDCAFLLWVGKGAWVLKVNTE